MRPAFRVRIGSKFFSYNNDSMFFKNCTCAHTCICAFLTLSVYCLLQIRENTWRDLEDWQWTHLQFQRRIWTFSFKRLLLQRFRTWTQSRWIIWKDIYWCTFSGEDIATDWKIKKRHSSYSPEVYSLIQPIFREDGWTPALSCRQSLPYGTYTWEQRNTQLWTP